MNSSRQRLLQSTLRNETDEVIRDPHGYLKEPLSWNKQIAMQIALEESIEMTEEHWEVVCIVRDFYLEFNTSPAMRMLVTLMTKKLGENKGSSRHLFKLFPKGPAKQATKIAGLPKPVRCL